MGSIIMRRNDGRFWPGGAKKEGKSIHIEKNSTRGERRSTGVVTGGHGRAAHDSKQFRGMKGLFIVGPIAGRTKIPHRAVVRSPRGGAI